MTMLDIGSFWGPPDKMTIGRPHLGKDDNLPAGYMIPKPQSKPPAPVAGAAAKINTQHIDPYHAYGMFSHSLRRGDVFKIEGREGTFEVVTIGDGKNGRWIMTDRPDLRSFHTTQFEVVTITPMFKYAREEERKEAAMLAAVKNESEMIPGLIATNELKQGDRIWIDGVGRRRVARASYNPFKGNTIVICDFGLCFTNEQHDKVILMSRVDGLPESVTPRPGTGPKKSFEYFPKAVDTDPECPSSGPRPVPGLGIPEPTAEPTPETVPTLVEASEIMVGGRPTPKAQTGILVFPTKSHLKSPSDVTAITAMKETLSFDEVMRQYEAGEIDTRQMMYLTEQIKFNRHPQLYMDTFAEEIGYADVETGG